MAKTVKQTAKRAPKGRAKAKASKIPSKKPLVPGRRAPGKAF